MEADGPSDTGFEITHKGGPGLNQLSTDAPVGTRKCALDHMIHEQMRWYFYKDDCWMRSDMLSEQAR